VRGATPSVTFGATSPTALRRGGSWLRVRRATRPVSRRRRRRGLV